MVNGYNPQDFSYFHRGGNLVQHTLKGDFNWVTAQEVENLMSGETSGRVKR